MADEENVQESPPLPRRGTYDIDFDALEDINPFASSKKFGSSPPIRSEVSPFPGDFDDGADPFKSRSKVGNSPPCSPLAGGENGEVFKSKPKLTGSSPQPSPNMGDQPGSPIAKNTEVKDNELHVDAASSSAVSESPGNCDASSPPTPRESDTVAENKGSLIQKKKIVKKAKGSKFKPPKNMKGAKTDHPDLQIFMPGCDNNNTLPLSSPGTVEREETAMSKENTVEAVDSVLKGDLMKKPLDDVPLDAAPDAMASSGEIDQQFIDDENVEEAKHVNKGDTATSNAVSDIDSPKQIIEERPRKPDNPSLLLNDSPVPSLKEKPLQSSASPKESKEHTQGNEGLLMSSTPVRKQQEDGLHPALGALKAAQTDCSSTKDTDLKKNPTIMEKSLNPEEGGDAKADTVVQLVQNRGNFFTQKVLRYSQSDWNKLKQEMELNFQTSLLNKERDWSLLLAERDKKISSMDDTNRRLKHTNEDMRMVVAEFEKTISQLQADKEKHKTDSTKGLQAVEYERDQALEDLQSVESAFSDLHRRYEKSKTIIEGFKKNEEQLKQCVEDLQARLKKSDAKLQSLKSQAEEKLDKANEDIEKIKKSTKQDIIRLEAAVRKSELRISGLEESLQRKEKENQELTAICDELIAKVGS